MLRLSILTISLLIVLCRAQTICPNFNPTVWSMEAGSCGTNVNYPYHVLLKMAFPSTCSCGTPTNTGYAFSSVKMRLTSSSPVPITGECRFQSGVLITTDGGPNVTVSSLADLNAGIWCTQGTAVRIEPVFMKADGTVCPALERPCSLPNAFSYSNFDTTLTRNVTCFGNTDGQAAVSRTFEMAQTTPAASTSAKGVISTLPGGTYKARVTTVFTNPFTGSCTALGTSTAVVSAPATPISLTLTSNTPAACESSCYGYLNFTVTGGRTAISMSYSIWPAAIGCPCPAIGSYAVLPGTYTIDVTDRENLAQCKKTFGPWTVTWETPTTTPPETTQTTTQTITTTASPTTSPPPTTTQTITTTVSPTTSPPPTTTQTITTTASPTTTPPPTTTTTTASTTTAQPTTTTSVTTDPSTTTDTGTSSDTATVTETPSATPSVTETTTSDGTSSQPTTQTSAPTATTTPTGSSTTQSSSPTTQSSVPTVSVAPSCIFKDKSGEASISLQLTINGCMSAADRKSLLRSLEQLAKLCPFELYESSYNGTGCKRQSATSQMLVGSQASDQTASLQAAQTAASSPQTSSSYPSVSAGQISSSPKNKEKGTPIWVFGAIAAGAIVLVAVIAVAVFLIVKKRKSFKKGSQYELMLQ